MVKDPKYMFCLDNGHGSDTKGKRSPDSTLMEYEYNRAIVGAMIPMMEYWNIQYFNVVPELNDIPLKERVRRANELVTPLKKIYVSIHGNAYGDSWHAANGIETFTYINSTTSPWIARIFQKHIVLTTALKDRCSVKYGHNGYKEQNLYVCRHTLMPAILTENGFFSNTKECELMKTIGFRNQVAKAHVTAMQEIENIN